MDRSFGMVGGEAWKGMWIIIKYEMNECSAQGPASAKTISDDKDQNNIGLYEEETK